MVVGMWQPGVMCRNITTLRGLDPPATPEEVIAAARQYVRKVSGVQRPSVRTAEAVDEVVERIAAATTDLLAALPARQKPPASLPPLRRTSGTGRVMGAPPVSG